MQMSSVFTEYIVFTQGGTSTAPETNMFADFHVLKINGWTMIHFLLGWFRPIFRVGGAFDLT